MRTLVALAATALAAVSTQATAQDTKVYEQQVLAVAYSELQEWIADPDILYAIREQNQMHKGLRPRRIKAMDAQWISEGSRGEMVSEMLDRQGSIILRDRREKSSGVITEIIVMDAYGLNVAISDRTSDYFQGDEAKWQETYLKGAGAIHIGDIEFDDSTQKVQTQVSLTVTDPDNNDVIGAVTFGIDLNVLSN